MGAVLPFAMLAAVAAPPTVAGVPLRDGGGLAERERLELGEQLREGMGRLEASVVQLEPSPACVAASCLAELARGSEADYVVIAEARRVEGDYAITIDLIAADEGTVVATVAQTCEVCGLREAGDTIRGLAATMQAKIDALAVGPAVVAIDTRPAGAIVELDGETVGRAPVERELEAGEHWASARLDGFVTQRRQVNAVAGVREAITFDLPPVPREEAPRDRRLAIAGWALLGFGGAAIGTGAALIVIDERPDKTRCTGPNVDDQGDCRKRYATLEAGAAVVALGAASAIAGLTMALIGRKRQRRTTAVIGPRSIGIAGRF